MAGGSAPGSSACRLPPVGVQPPEKWPWLLCIGSGQPWPLAPVPTSSLIAPLFAHRGQGAEETMLLVVDTGSEEQGVKASRAMPITEDQTQQAVDHQRMARRVSELATEGARFR